MAPKKNNNKAGSPRPKKGGGEPKDETVVDKVDEILSGPPAATKDAHPEENPISPVAANNDSTNGNTPVNNNDSEEQTAATNTISDLAAAIQDESGEEKKEEEDSSPVDKVDAIINPKKEEAATPAADAAPKKEIVYKIGKPSVEGEVIPHFANGAVFRIVTLPERKWSFYNDCQNYEVHIKVTVGAASKLETLGKTEVVKNDDDTMTYSVVVYPAETQELFQGDKAGTWKISIEAMGLSEEFRAKLRAEADEKVQAEIKAIAAVTDTKDPEERLKICLAKGLAYVDLEFRPEQTALARPQDMRQLPDCPWQRPQDYLPDELKDKVCLFNKIEPNDIDQGALGDCWLLCAIAAVAEFPKRIEKLFVHPESGSKLASEIKAGAMRVTLNKNGWWTNYITDSYLPVMAGKPSFTKNVEDLTEQWASLLEKVYAKVSGSYACITGGDALLALPDLTGFPINRFDTEWTDALGSKEKSDELFDNLVKYDEAHYLINLNTPGVDKTDYNGSEEKKGEKVTPSGLDKKYADAGLGMGHAYSVLTVKHFPHQGFQLLKIRNPWGGGAEWSGKWGDNSDMWTQYPAIAEACEASAGDDGCFWMEWEDVKAYFCGGGVCMVKPTWNDYRVRGVFDGLNANVVLEVTVTKPTKMFCVLSQPDKRGHPKNDKSVKYAPAMVSVWRKDAEKDGQYRFHLNSSGDADAPTEQFKFQKSRDCAMLYEFTPEHGPYLVVPRVNKVKPDFHRDFVIGLISESPIDGSDVQVKFKNFQKDCKLFKNYPRMEYKPEEVPEIETEYQRTPQDGAPQNKKGTTLSF